MRSRPGANALSTAQGCQDVRLPGAAFSSAPGIDLLCAEDSHGELEITGVKEWLAQGRKQLEDLEMVALDGKGSMASVNAVLLNWR